MLNLSNQREKLRLKVTNSSNYGAFDLMRDMSEHIRQIIKYEYKEIYPENSDTGIFLHGSPSRNEMTSYSDIDILIFDKEDTERINGDKLLKNLEKYGFGKIDELGWRNHTSIKDFAEKSIIDGNKVLDSYFVCGNNLTSDLMNGIKTSCLTRERSLKNIIFQRFYLEHYYSNRSSLEIPNVKYDNGGYRDFLIFNWSSDLLDMYNNKYKPSKNNIPKLKISVDNILNYNIIAKKEHSQLLEAIEFITILRNEILHINYDTKDKNITHLDENTEKRLWESSTYFLKKNGAKKYVDIRQIYFKHKNTVYTQKMNLFNALLEKEEQLKYIGWKQEFDNALKGNIVYKADDVLLKIANIWGAHNMQSKKLFENITNNYYEDNNWEVLASIACSNLCNPKLLEKIREKCQEDITQWYILKIISRNPNTDEYTLNKISSDTKLGHYGGVAKKRLEQGIEAAIKRCS